MDKSRKRIKKYLSKRTSKKKKRETIGSLCDEKIKTGENLKLNIKITEKNKLFNTFKSKSIAYALMKFNYEKQNRKCKRRKKKKKTIHIVKRMTNDEIAQWKQQNRKRAEKKKITKIKHRKERCGKWLK